MTAHSALSQHIWHYLCQRGIPLATSDIGHHFDLSAYRALHYLQILCREGKVVRLLSGRGRASLWQGIKARDKSSVAQQDNILRGLHNKTQ